MGETTRHEKYVLIDSFDATSDAKSSENAISLSPHRANLCRCQQSKTHVIERVIAGWILTADEDPPHIPVQQIDMENAISPSPHRAHLCSYQQSKTHVIEHVIAGRILAADEDPPRVPVQQIDREKKRKHKQYRDDGKSAYTFELISRKKYGNHIAKSQRSSESSSLSCSPLSKDTQVHGSFPALNDRGEEHCSICCQDYSHLSDFDGEAKSTSVISTSQKRLVSNYRLRYSFVHTKTKRAPNPMKQGKLKSKCEDFDNNSSYTLSTMTSIKEEINKELLKELKPLANEDFDDDFSKVSHSRLSLEKEERRKLSRPLKKFLPSVDNHPPNPDPLQHIVAPAFSSSNVSRWIDPTSRRSKEKTLEKTFSLSLDLTYDSDSDCEEDGDKLAGEDQFSQSPRLVIPIGPRFQAEIPQWEGTTNIRHHNIDDDLKWFGTEFWPMPNIMTTNTIVVGKNRSEACSCDFPRSIDCVQQHINEARKLLQAEIGTAFSSWKFDEMGECVSKSWTLKEQKEFESLVGLNPLSNDDMDFWKLAMDHFPDKSCKSLVNYYYNVYIPRHMSKDTRASFDGVDSDDDNIMDYKNEGDCSTTGMGIVPICKLRKSRITNPH